MLRPAHPGVVDFLRSDQGLLHKFLGVFFSLAKAGRYNLKSPVEDEGR